MTIDEQLRRAKAEVKRLTELRWTATRRRPHIIRELENGPATSRDIADALGFDMALCSAILVRLWKEGVCDRRRLEGYPRVAPYLYTLKD